jgi:hypothetical protein
MVELKEVESSKRFSFLISFTPLGVKLSPNFYITETGNKDNFSFLKHQKPNSKNNQGHEKNKKCIR